MRKYKILYLNHVSYIGGAEIALLDLLTYVDRETYTHVVLAPDGDLLGAVQHLHLRSVSIPELPGLNRYTLPHFLFLLPKLLSSVKREKPDLIYANTNFASLYSGVMTKFLRIPAMGHIRDIEPLGRMGCWAIQQNLKILAISQAVQNALLINRVSPSQIALVYDGVDLQHYRTRSVQNRDSLIILGVIGQLGQRKGHLYLLKALRDLIRTFPKIMLWIVGKEPEQSTERYAEQLYQYVEQMNLEHHVRFWGFQKDIPNILAQLDILLLPSLQEPFGKIVVEAMAMGKPVIASKVGGVPEIVVDGKTGILVPPRDPEAIQRALEHLIHKKETRIQMGLEGQKRVKRFFNIQRTVRHTEQIYEQLLANV
jgi:glycosyltransferase involved in cell wall biosynthesis